MIKTISVTDARNRLSAIIRWVSEQGGEVVIENRGVPKAVIISYDNHEDFRTLKEEARRETLSELEKLIERMSVRNADMTEEEVEQLAEEITQETFERMIKEGKVRFQS